MMVKPTKEIKRKEHIFSQFSTWLSYFIHKTVKYRHIMSIISVLICS